MKLAAILTVIETYVLVRWLQLTKIASRATAAGFFFVGILIEELVRFKGIRGAMPKGRDLALVLLGVAVEITGWSIPLVLKLTLAQTIIFLFMALEVEHAIIKTATNGSPFLENLPSVTDFSAVEALGGGVWLNNPTPETLALFIVASLLEHTQGIRQGLGLR